MRLMSPLIVKQKVLMTALCNYISNADSLITKLETFAAEFKIKEKLIELCLLMVIYVIQECEGFKFC